MLKRAITRKAVFSKKKRIVSMPWNEKSNIRIYIYILLQFNNKTLFQFYGRIKKRGYYPVLANSQSIRRFLAHALSHHVTQSWFVIVSVISDRKIYHEWNYNCDLKLTQLKISSSLCCAFQFLVINLWGLFSSMGLVCTIHVQLYTVPINKIQ